MKRFVFGVLATVVAGMAAGTAGLTIEKLIDIKHPSDPVWSPDGRHIAFVWDRAGISNFYLADPAGAGPPLPLTSFPDGQVAGAFWSHDSRLLYFPHGGDLWRVSLAGGDARPVWHTSAPKTGFTLSPDGTRVAFAGRAPGGGFDLFVRSLGDDPELRLAHDMISIGGIAWAPDGTRLLYTAGAETVPHDETPEYSGAKIIYRATERTGGRSFMVPSQGGTPVALSFPLRGGALHWLESTHIVIERQSADFKRRTISVADVTTGQLRPVHEDAEEQFWSIPANAGPEGQGSPDGRWIAFLSDLDGWDHLYVMPAGGGKPVQITTGHFEAWRPVWSHDSRKIAFDANQPEAPGRRHLGVADIGSGLDHPAVTYLTAGPGTNIAPVWSPDDRRLVYQHTDTQNSADLFVIDAKPGSTPVRLSDSMPTDLDRAAFVQPEFVHFPGADGQSVPGWLFVPPGLDRTKKHPAIVWIHGDGINQNYDGWHVQRNYAVYYSFHQYLLQKGYVVFAPDYRGSIGYGRAWRNSVYMDVGGKDAKDAWMSANYLKSLPYIDGSRIGVWGLSYGGFFTLIALTDQPALFRAGVDVAGVVDYAMYYTDPYHGAWTASRIGTPEQNPQVYAKASPLSHMDQLARPLLVLHGTADVNVPYLESVRLMDRLLKLGKGDLVTFMAYPGEFHYFTRAHVLRDAWRRVDEFFETNLKPQE